MANRRIFDLVFKTRGLEKAKTDTNSLDNSLNKLATTAKGLAGGFALMQTGMKAIEFAKTAAQTESVSRSFNNSGFSWKALSNSSGVSHPYNCGVSYSGI